jgi:hypothetical protein
LFRRDGEGNAFLEGGSPAAANGATSAIGSLWTCSSQSPMTAFQKPMAVQGSVSANSTSMAIPSGSELLVESVRAINQNSPTPLATTSAAKPRLLQRIDIIDIRIQVIRLRTPSRRMKV